MIVVSWQGEREPAAMRLVSVERETAAMHEWVAANSPELVSSQLIQTELLRAVGRSQATAESSIVDGLDAIDLLPATAAIFERAGRLSPSDLRSLDAIHLATALDLADDCDGIITYDLRLAEASQTHGLAVLAPN